MGHAPESIADALDWFRKRFRAESARDLEVSFQMELSGEGGGVLSLTIDRGLLRAEAAAVPGPDVLYRLSAPDLFGVLAGERNPDLLFMEKRIQIEGDLSLALKLRSLFRAGG
ncbi:MAG: SCP2 sterol-binding domain-containing protein [Myxococcota bacterium]